MKLWNGRFEKDSDKLADEYNTSLPVDKKMYRQDIAASLAHAKMLEKCGIISDYDAKSIKSGLESILKDIENGYLEFENAEDIHMFVEEKLTARIGNPGKKLHTARSRNDQVVTDFKLYIKDSITEIKAEIKELIATLVALSKQHTNTYMPGFTHMQKAQPITLAFHLMAYAEMFYRDLVKFDNAYKNTDFCPLGSGALAGTTYPIDRKFTANELGFADITYNALDAVSDRDYVAEYLFVSTLTMTHLSRFAEEIITWASNEYRFIELSDAFSTGSSIMPQKKNPDMAELVRGKTGRALGNLTAMLSILKALPLAYNKDMQEDKDLLFQTEDALIKSLVIFRKMLETASFNKKNMLSSAALGFTNATDFADYLTKKGAPFREAHAITGKLVAYCISIKKPIEKLPLIKLQEFSPLVEDDIFKMLSIKTLINNRSIEGGTAPVAVRQAIRLMEKKVAKIK